MPESGLAQVGGKVRTSKERCAYPPTCAKPPARQPTVKPLKIKNIISLKAKKKRAKISRQRREQEKQKSRQGGHENAKIDN